MAGEDTAASIAASLATLARVSVLNYVDGRDRADQLRILESLGFKHSEIAEILGMKPNTVTQALKRLKQRGEASD